MIGDLQIVLVGMSEMQVSGDTTTVLSCLGLGSCIGLSLYDPFAHVGGVAHIVLPSAPDGRNTPYPKYADTAIPHLIEELLKLGATKRNLAAKIVGGARMGLIPGQHSIFKTGERNIEATQAALASAGLSLAASDTGGNKGRTMRLFVGTGNVTVSTGGGDVREI